LIVVGGLIVALVTAPGASAHRPLWDGNGAGVTEIPNLTTSFAIYRDLESSGEVDFYAFEAEAGDELYAGINVPALRELESYGVSIALVGPGLPEVEYDVLPAEHPEGLGALIFPSVAGEDFYEGRQQIEMDLPESGTYYLLAWNPDGETGKYVMDVGREEVFGPADLFRFPIWWVRVHTFFGHTPYMISAGVLMVGVIAVSVLRRRAHRPAINLAVVAERA
jgi:hypothetical protein